MIRQHFLQQQRLNHNHDRLLERYQRILPPQISEFRPFGSSSLPGRNYEQYLNSANGNYGSKNSLAALSRAGIGSSSEIYRFMGGGSSENLPNNVSSTMKHSRRQSMSLVHAEKFEPVQIYKHPVFGPTPAYIRPLHSSRAYANQTNIEDSDEDTSDDDDDEVQPPKSQITPVKSSHIEETKTSSTSLKDTNDADEEEEEESINMPKGYISYKKWKRKYEDLIPVNPLLYNIYTRRNHGSINSYGQSVYASLNHTKQHRPSNRDEDVMTPTPSDIGSFSSEIPRENSSTSSRHYHRLQPQLLPSTNRPRPLEPIRSGDYNDLSTNKISPPESPVPYLSRNKPVFITPTPVSNTIPSKPITSLSTSPIGATSSPSVPSIGVAQTGKTTIGNTTDLLSPPTTSINTSNVPPAPPMSPSLSLTTSNSSNQTPSNPPVLSVSSQPSSINTPNIPKAPPMPDFLTATKSNPSYQTPSNIPVLPPPTVPFIPKTFSTTSSTATYQTPSSVSLPVPSIPAMSNPMQLPNPTKAVTFGGSSSFPMGVNDVSSSSDSDDDEKKKRRRQKKRQALAGVGVDMDSSSSDD